MPVIRKIQIENFRTLKRFEWIPSPGINCLVGPGDSGKSSILEAVDLCLSARRNIQISDADFHKLDVNAPIRIAVTLGNLDDELKSIDAYGLYLRGFNQQTGAIESEPGAALETVLTVQLTVEADLEPQWSLVSERAAEQSQARNLNWADRVRLAPTRLGAFAEQNLSWRRGSILNRISEERADAGAVLAAAAREARSAFGEEAKSQLEQALKIVLDTAKCLGVPVGNEVKAMLDAHSASLNTGTISLHDAGGVPLKGLGLGSARLLIAGLQRRAAREAAIILIDELEHGLEPHRIIRLLDALGAKERNPPLQVFVTTHSPVAVRELSAHQLFVVRRVNDRHEARLVSVSDEVQGATRRYPEVLLAASVIVCEGASEVGLLRGLDHYRGGQGEPSINARGVALVDGTGSPLFGRAQAFRSLGYRTSVLRDSDVHPTPDLEAAFRTSGGTVFAWREGRALEDDLFFSLSDSAIDKLIACAIELKEEILINKHIESASDGTLKLQDIKVAASLDGFSPEHRALLSKAAKSNKGWFKTVSAMEAVARDIIGPDLPNADAGFSEIIDEIFRWAADADL